MTTVSFGDLVLDVIVQLEQPLAPGADASSRIALRPGGQGANVAAWVARLGGASRFIGKHAHDAAGRLASTALAAYGVEVVGPVESAGNGVIVSLVTPDGDRSMCSDRGVAPDFHPDELDPAWLAGCTHLHVSGYALLREPVRRTAARAVELARAEGACISVDLSSWSAIRDFGPAAFRAVVAEITPEVVFANEDEDGAIGGPLENVLWILKRGAGGCCFAGDERPAQPVVEVVDTTGAGDALAAGWIVGGPDLALRAAARCVQQAGSMP